MKKDMPKDHPHFLLSVWPRILMASACHLLEDDYVVNFMASSSLTGTQI